MDSEGGPTGHSGIGGGPASSSDSADAAMGDPSIGGASPAGEMSTSNEGAALAGAAGGMEFGGLEAPMGGWGPSPVAGPSVNTQGQVSGSHHAGTAADSFAEAIGALDAAIGAMPDISTNTPPSTGLPGMGYAEGQIASPGMAAFGGYGLAGAAPGIDAFGGYGPGGWGGGTTQGGVAAPGIGAFGGYSADPGLEAFGGLGTQQGPGVGYGTGALGEMGNPTNTVDPGLQAANAAALSQSQGLTADVGWAGAGTPTNVGNPMGYGMDTSSVMGPGGVGTGAPGGPAQNAGAGQMGSMGALQGTAAQEGTLDAQAAQAQAERDAEAAEAEDAMALARDVTAPMDAAATSFREEEANRMFGRDRTTMSQAEADALEGWSGGPQATGQDIDTEDENEDYSGMPTGATVDQTVGALIQAIQDPKEAKNRGWLAHDLARSILGLPPSTPESRAKDALSQLESQGQQEAMEMDVSTGEDDRTRMEKVKAVSNFRKQYKWAKDMSAKEIQAYMDNPALLKLKISNEQMRSMDPKTMTANDIRQLWSPAMSA